MSDQRERPDVTIVGGGIAGLTAALRLVERGFSVTLYEKEEWLGGNLGAVRSGDLDFEVYPHMFGHWYENFWDLVVDALAEEGATGNTLDAVRDRHFKPVPEAGFLQPMAKGQDRPSYRLLRDNGSAGTMVDNLFSGILPVPHMFLAAYAIIDLLTQDYHDRKGDQYSSEQSLNGFLVDRFYATESVAKFYDMLIENIWSVDSYLVSAYAFQCFSAFQFREPKPQCWAIRKGNSYDTLIVPLQLKLERSGLCRIHTSAEVNGVSLDEQGNVCAIGVRTGGSQQAVAVRNLILAATPAVVAQLVKQVASPGHEAAAQTPAAAAQPLADLQQRIANVPIVRRLPELSNLRRLTSEPIPLLYVTFRPGAFKEGDIPDYYVALQDSRYSLTFVKVNAVARNSLNPELQQATVLAIAASNFSSLPVRFKGAALQPAESQISAVIDEAEREAALLILKEFRRYVPSFRLGRHWGDPESDVIWDAQYTFFRTNTGQQLFINQVGSHKVAPRSHYAAVPNLYFAGDYSDTPIVIATVEAAVTSGLQAARAFCQSVSEAEARGRDRPPPPIAVKRPKVYPLPLMFALKILLAPHAVLARYWADALEFPWPSLFSPTRPCRR